jgi:phytoene dehydrogenase-like protein
MPQYDAIVIGAGMSGLAAAIRLGMADKKVALFESHRIAGGLNSFYQRGKRQLDVGLHALTNYVPAGSRKAPLTKLLRQLRIPYEDWQLSPQSFSAITFPQARLEFDNDYQRLRQSVYELFPNEIDGFERLTSHIRASDDVSLEGDFLSARMVMGQFIHSPQLIDMLMCPLQFYGSSWPNDMDFRQMATMYKALFLEGFARPYGGVRTIINSLEKRLLQLPVDIFYQSPVDKIIQRGGKACGVLVKEVEYTAEHIFSSAGLVETNNLISSNNDSPIGANNDQVGALAFVECLMHFPQIQDQYSGLTACAEETINFHCRTPNFHYQPAQQLIDVRSAVICLPNNYQRNELNERQVRVTFLANYQQWKELRNDKAVYKQHKLKALEEAFNLAKELYPNDMPASHHDLAFHDVFTPTTVEFYTRHRGGAIYGSPTKSRLGTTSVSGLYLTGTDQGFLGIVGALLSGITMANIHALQPKVTHSMHMNNSQTANP